MALTHTPPGELGSHAPPFQLLGVDGKQHTTHEFSSGKGLLVAFICNHCPYVKAIWGRLDALARKFQPLGIPVVGINSNDSRRYPEDRFEAMQALHQERRFAFQYLHDPTQEVARAYGAVCTPDFFLYRSDPNLGGKLELQYRGRLDDSWKDEAQVRSRDLEAAMDAVVCGVAVPPLQVPSMGCSIKWLE